MSRSCESCAVYVRAALWMYGLEILLSCLSWAAPAPTKGRAVNRPALTCATIKVVDEYAIDVSATSPDGLSTVCIKEDRADDEYSYTSVYLWRRGRLQVLMRYKELGPGSTVLWSADSKAFAWNFTYGGASSGWTTAVFDFRSGRLREIDRHASVVFHRRLRHACKEDWTDDNSYLMHWTGNRSLLIAMEAHPGGLDCRRPAATDFYEVAIPAGRVIKRLRGSEMEAAQREFAGP